MAYVPDVWTSPLGCIVVLTGCGNGLHREGKPMFNDVDIEMREAEITANIVAAGGCAVCTCPLDDPREGAVTLLPDRHDLCIPEDYRHMFR